PAVREGPAARPTPVSWYPQRQLGAQSRVADAIGPHETGLHPRSRDRFVERFRRSFLPVRQGVGRVDLVPRLWLRGLERRRRGLGRGGLGCGDERSAEASNREAEGAIPFDTLVAF